MNKAEFLGWLEEIETTLPVASWKMHGFRVWPLIRLQLFAANATASLQHDAVGGGKVRNALAIAHTFRAWAAAAAADWRNNIRTTDAADAVFLAYSAGVQPVVDGKKCNPLLGPYVDLARAAGHRVAVWEMCHDGDYNIPRSVPSAYVQPQLVALRAASLFLHRPAGPVPEIEGHADLVARVTAAGLQNRYNSIGALERDAYFVRRVADWFKARLAVVNPSHGFVADYGPREQGFCLACRELGIRTIEIQHGVVNDVHPVYARWRNVPAGGYETRPSTVWCWDEEAAGAIRAWAGGSDTGVTAIVGGDPWREQWVSPDSPAVRALDRQIDEEKRRIGATKHVLVTLDPTGPPVPDVALEAMRSSPPDWCYWVRLHPVGQRVRIPEVIRLLESRGIRSATVASASQWPLHGLLRHMDAHVTPFWSTVVIEAADAGVSSVACTERAGEVFARQLADGTLKIALTADDVVSALATQIARRRQPRSDGRPDPARAMRAALSGPRVHR